MGELRPIGLPAAAPLRRAMQFAGDAQGAPYTSLHRTRLARVTEMVDGLLEDVQLILGVIHEEDPAVNVS